MKEKFVPQRDDFLIYNDRNRGPTFGKGYDIILNDGSYNHSIADFPCSYNRVEGVKLENNKDTLLMFLGGDKKYFKVEEYEVFQLFYK